MSTSRAHALAIFAKRLEKAPFTRESSAPGGALRTAPSMRPLADDVLMYTGRAVRKTSRNPTSRRANISSNARPRCAIIGRDSAARISGRTSVGPGRKKVPKVVIARMADGQRRAAEWKLLLSPQSPRGVLLFRFPNHDGSELREACDVHIRTGNDALPPREADVRRELVSRADEHRVRGPVAHGEQRTPQSATL